MITKWQMIKLCQYMICNLEHSQFITFSFHLKIKKKSKDRIKDINIFVQFL